VRVGNFTCTLLLEPVVCIAWPGTKPLPHNLVSAGGFSIECTVSTENGEYRTRLLWIVVAVEDNIIEKNVSQFSHTGETPFGYSDLGKELGYAGDSPMAL
jgi:hypothetical protein